MFKKRLIYFISIYFFLCLNVFGDQKENIINQINNLNSVEFSFNQISNNKTEQGNCLLEFPGKLKCNYYDKKQKELIINKKILAITQKKYNKTYFYPISKSPFMNILYKDKLLKAIKEGTLKTATNDFQLIYKGKNEIIVLFDKKSFQLSGWKIIDQYNNRITFELKIIAKNSIFQKNTFKIPSAN